MSQNEAGQLLLAERELDAYLAGGGSLEPAAVESWIASSPERTSIAALLRRKAKASRERALPVHAAEQAAPVDPAGEDDLLARLARRAPAAARYELREEIARGGMGRIVEAFDVDLRRSVAMKAMHASSLEHDGALERFIEESQVTAQLAHPGVIPVHELGVDAAGEVYFTMAKVEGRDLQAVFSEHWASSEDWPLPRVLGAVLRVCETMAYAHSRGVIHRDLKPGNVMVGSFGEVYVVDWGLAKVLGRAEAAAAPVATDRRAPSAQERAPVLTEQGDLLGTPCFMSPEQAEGRIDALDARSDVYAVGALLYTLFAGAPPYVAGCARRSSFEIVEALRAGAPPALAPLAPSTPPELLSICDKAMARDPARRYATMVELGGDLRAFLEGRVVRAHRTGAWIELRKWVARNRATAGALAGLVLAVLVGLGAVSVVSAQGRVRAERDRDRTLAFSLAQRDEGAWPATPELQPALETWLEDARRVARLVEPYRAERDALAARALPAGAGGAGFTSQRGRQYQTLAEVQEEAALEAFLDASADLGPRIADVERRLGTARTLEERSVSGPEARARWSAASDAIAASPRYGGLRLRPQLGLLPLREDPRSGLWEFAHLLSGEPPRWDGDGPYARTEATGVVLVLLPGGATRVGSLLASEGPECAPYVDPFRDEIVDDDEGPPVDVRLDPFFMSKYELTQAQYMRVMPQNPSSIVAPVHPVETLSWFEAAKALERLALTIPTEAQYEYAQRAGSVTPFPGGPDHASLAGSANFADRTFAEAGESNGEEPFLDLADGHVFHAPVGSLAANALGLHDVAGNVWSWCRDGFRHERSLRPGDGLNEEGRDGEEGVIRGGSWSSHPSNLRSANRYHYGRSGREADVGIQPARPIDP